MKQIVPCILFIFLVGCKTRTEVSSSLNGVQEKAYLCRTKRTTLGYKDSAIDEIKIEILDNNSEFKDQQGVSYSAEKYPIWFKVEATFKDRRKDLIFESPGDGSISSIGGSFVFYEPDREVANGNKSLLQGSPSSIVLDQIEGDTFVGRIFAKDYKKSEVLLTNRLGIVCAKK